MKLQGGVGFAQKLAFTLVEMQFAADSILIYNLPYLLLFPKIKCQMNGIEIANGSADFDKYCNPQYICNNNKMQSLTYQVDWKQPYSLRNWIDSFSMFCASNFQISLIAMNFFIGQALMCLFIPKLQDKYGRKKVFLASSIVNFLTLAAIWCLPDHVGDSSKTKNTLLYLDALFLINGLATPGRTLTGYTYFMEMHPEEAQNMIGTIQMIIEGTIYIALTFFWMKFNRSWRWTLALACAMNFVGIILTILLLPDSPKWYYENKRYKECLAAIKRMARLNRSPHTIPSRDQFELLESQDVQEKNSEDERENLIRNGEAEINNNSASSAPGASFTGSNLINLIAMILVWLSASFCFYLISYQLKYIKGDMFTNGIVSSVSEIMAVTSSGIVLSFLGYTRTLTISYAIAFTGMLCLFITQTSDQRLLSIFILGSKFGVSQVFNLAYLGNMMLFPTSLLATSYGICNLFARGGTIFAPFVAELKPESIAQVVFMAVIGLSLMTS